MQIILALMAAALAQSVPAMEDSYYYQQLAKDETRMQSWSMVYDESTG